MKNYSEWAIGTYIAPSLRPYTSIAKNEFLARFALWTVLLPMVRKKKKRRKLSEGDVFNEREGRRRATYLVGGTFFREDWMDHRRVVLNGDVWLGAADDNGSRGCEEGDDNVEE